MQRDMDLIRKILIEVESAETFARPMRLQFESYTDEQISYHVMLLRQANFVLAIEFPGDTPVWKPFCLTWEGHEFLQAACDDTRWEKAKSIMTQGGGMVASILKDVLVALLTHQIPMPQ